MAIKWEEELVRQCYEIINKGGEVRIQFVRRSYQNKKSIIPIIRIYPENQVICEEVSLID